MCNLHWCYTFCTGVTLFALVLHLNCTALSQSESSNFFMYIINAPITFEEIVIVMINFVIFISFTNLLWQPFGVSLPWKTILQIWPFDLIVT